jgi:hypothetical protein
MSDHNTILISSSEQWWAYGALCTVEPQLVLYREVSFIRRVGNYREVSIIRRVSNYREVSFIRRVGNYREVSLIPLN